MANGVASELEPEWMILTWPRPMHFEHSAVDDHPGLSGSRAKLSASPSLASEIPRSITLMMLVPSGLAQMEQESARRRAVLDLQRIESSGLWP